MTSFWLAGDPGAGSGAGISSDLDCEVLVIGAGIVGMTAAYLLAAEGRDVVVAEADAIGCGTTGNTTAKLSASHGLRYDELERRHDRETAAAYARLNLDGLGLIGDLADRLEIDCDWREREAVTYTLDGSRLEEMQAEVAAARRSGLDCELRDTTELPFEVAGSVAVRGQAEFHPVKWLRGMARAGRESGVRLYENSRVISLERDGQKAVAGVDGKSITAGHVVVATHYPIFDRGLFFAKLSAQRSYCLGIRAVGPLPAGMFISADSPTRSVRTHPLDDGTELLIVGGEGHKSGQEQQTDERYQALEDWAREHFDVVSVDYRWSAQDPVSPDLLPYIGQLTRHTDNVLVATGFSKWGLAAGAGAAQILAGAVTGAEHVDAHFFDSKRLSPIAAGPTIVKENLNVAARMIGDRLSLVGTPDDIDPGDGAIVRSGVQRVAAFRDADGDLYRLSATCTHLGCEVRFNQAEESWDCPCHGSRFDARDGRVLEGPAVEPLKLVSEH